MDKLTDHPKLAGYFITSMSPSAREIELEWPDGHREKVKPNGNPSEHQHGEHKVRVYARGTQPHLDVQAKIAEYANKLEQLRAEAEQRVREEQEKLEADFIDSIAAEDEDPEEPSSGDPDFPCDVCGITGKFKSPMALQGHKRSAEHKAKAGAAA